MCCVRCVSTLLANFNVPQMNHFWVPVSGCSSPSVKAFGCALRLLSCSTSVLGRSNSPDGSWKVLVCSSRQLVLQPAAGNCRGRGTKATGARSEDTSSFFAD